MTQTFNLKDLIAPEFRYSRWTNCPARYRVFYGARNTGKSYTFLGIEVLDKILRDCNRNVVIFRQVFSDIKDTCFAQVQALIYKLFLFPFFQIKTHDMEIVYKKTGQKIVFCGCDRGTAVNGITCARGEITDFYFEEAFEIRDYELFRQIDGSLRGDYATKLKNVSIPKQCTFLMNPRSAEGCFIYDIFVKPFMPDRETTQAFLEEVGYRAYQDFSKVIEKGVGIALMQSTYKVNKWRQKNYDQIALETKKQTQNIYKCEFLGMWGVSGDVCYPEFSERHIIQDNLVKELPFSLLTIGIDTGFSNGEGKILMGSALEKARVHSAYAILLCGITNRDYKGIKKGSIVIIDEYYHSQEISGVKKSEPQLWNETLQQIMMWVSEYQQNPTMFRTCVKCFVDSGDAGSLSALIDLSRRMGVSQRSFVFDKSTKARIITRIRYERRLFDYGDLLISTKCKNLARELRNARVPKDGYRENINDHAINAMEYGITPLFTLTKEWANFKEYK